MEDPLGNILVRIQIIHRHGARSPAYITDFPPICGPVAYLPFQTFAPQLPPATRLKPPSPPPPAAACYPGQLTPLGAAQMFALGARLRARYHALLPPAFDPALVIVRSTAMRRTVESAVATLSGMYPAASARAAATSEARVPVAIEVRPRKEENMLPFRRHCNRLFHLRRAAHDAFTLPDDLHPARRVWLAAADHPTDSHTALALRDIAIAMRENGLEPQQWERIAEPPARRQISRLFVPEAWGLSVGKFVDELLQEASSPTSPAWVCKLYSAHDTTLLPLLAIFEDKMERGIPDFAADVVLETWVHPERKQDPLLRLKYRGEDVIVSGCAAYGALCPLRVVQAAVRKRIPSDLERACGGRYDPERVDTGATIGEGVAEAATGTAGEA